MSLLTLERSSPSPHESENEDLLSNSSYEGFVARDHYALCLSPRPFTSLGPGRSGDTLRIFSHLKKLVKMLRIQDKLRMAVELENNGLRKVTKYLVIIATSGHVDTEETVVLGTEQEGSTIRICLVLPLWRDTGIKLDGDGGFSVHTGDRHHFFKPSSVQSMWAALQMMYKATNDAQSNNYYVGGLSHTWMSFYTSMLTNDGMILNEWNLMEDVESFRPDYGSDVSNWSDERIALEKVLTTKLREVMLHQDLEEVTCKQLRLLLEEEMNMDLKDYRGFLDQQMLRILGQMERPSQIFDYLYLGSEWNASNLQELKELGVKYILNISREIDNFYPEEFKYLNIRLYDLPNSELMKHWDRTYTFLKEAKASGKKVLVHCKMGISRSAATVVAYTMKEYKKSLEDAVQHVKSKRSIVNPNDGFMNQLKAYEGILKARHNELWGKMAPSRPHPVALYRARSRSEPNIPELFTKEEDDTELQFLGKEGGGGGGGGGPDIFHTSCNHLDRQHLTADQKQNGSTPPRHIASKSYSRFPPQSTPIDKTENIRNFLASLPNVTVEDDAGFNENLCGTSESGSGYSSPTSSPTDDDHHLHSGRYKLVKEIRREHKGMSASEPPDQRHQGEAEEVQQGRGGSEEDTDMGIVMKELSSEEQKALGEELVALDASLNFEGRATSSSSHKTSKPEGQERGKGTTTTEKERVQPMAQIPAFHKPIRSTSLPRNIGPQYHPHPHPPPSTTPSDSLVAEHGSTTNASEIPSESNYEPSISPSEQSVQQRAARAAEGGLMDTSSPIIELPQIHSVPERIKEIEEMHSLKSTSKSPTVCDSTLVSSGGERKDGGSATALPMETETPLASRNEEEQNIDGGNDNASLTRASSGHSISSSLSNDELKHLTLVEEDIASKTPPPAAPPTTIHNVVMTTRHSSLSPSPLPQSRQGVALGSDDHTARASSCVHLSEPTKTSAVVIEEVSQLTQQLGSGAVKARVMDIEERNRDEKSASSDELSVRRQSPPYQPRSSSSSEVVVPTAGPVYEARDLKQIVSLQQPQRRPSSEIIQEKKLSLQDLHNRRESTPPAFLSAWNTLVDEVPTAPVQDLKKKFEDSDSVSVSSSVGSGASAGPRTHHVSKMRTKMSSNLRRTQSLKDMELPAAKIRYRVRKNRAKVPSNSDAGVRTSSPFL